VTLEAAAAEPLAHAVERAEQRGELDLSGPRKGTGSIAASAARGGTLSRTRCSASAA